jgi:hypothetical protein
VARERVRQELARLLVAPRAGDALRLLRRTGLEADLVAEPADDAPDLVDRVPPELAVRRAAWLRGSQGAAPARVESALTRLRFPRRLVQRVAALVRHHPVERLVDPASDASVRRLLRRVGDDLPALLALREAELAGAGDGPAALAARRAVERLREGIARVRAAGDVALQRLELALDGADVMRALGCGPGPAVGEALHWLTERVLDDPACNTPERLRALLQERGGGANGSRGS